MEDYFEITHDDVSLDEVIARLTHPQAGAVATFVGVVRGESDGERIRYLEYEAYPPMARETLCEVGEEIHSRWPTIQQVTIVHRVGRLSPGEKAVVIAVTAAHRAEVFPALSYAIERVKEVVPIWKKEVGEKGETWKSAS